MSEDTYEKAVEKLQLAEYTKMNGAGTDIEKHVAAGNNKPAMAGMRAYVSGIFEASLASHPESGPWTLMWAPSMQPGYMIFGIVCVGTWSRVDVCFHVSDGPTAADEALARAIRIRDSM